MSLEKYYNKIISILGNSQKFDNLDNSIHYVERVLQIFKPQEISIALNGGKESSVLLFVFFTSLVKLLKLKSDSDVMDEFSKTIKQINYLLFDNGDEFEEILTYLTELEQVYTVKYRIVSI